MGKKIKRILSIALTMCVLLSCVAVGSFTANAGTSASGIDYGLVDNIQYGNILHCWNWSYNNIRMNLQRIAEQGFTAIQTSPAQILKESVNDSWSTVAGQWWTFYQPIGFTVENSGRGLGSKDELIALCNEAHRYNIKVIVDVVFNHLANDYGHAGTIHPFVPEEFKTNMDLWHQPLNYEISNYNNRYDVTHYSLLKLPDLNTGHDTVQWNSGNYLKELIYCGVDGFRFDAAKHIETPSDHDGTRSEFWYNVLSTATSYAQSTRGFTPFYYGEILDGTGGVDIGAYTYYMSVTDSQGSENIRNGVMYGNSGQAAQNFSSNGSAEDRTILWNESHDEYIADNDYTRTIDSWHLNKTWGLTGTRNKAAGLYLARPDNTGQRIGVASQTAWTSWEVKAINQFKNRFAGQNDYLASYGSFAYNVRGGQGAVIVNTGQSNGSAWVSVPSCGMGNGTYKDQISGNTFTVSDGWLYGDMGSSGIAVVYNKGPEASIHPGTTAYRSDTYTLTLHTANADHGRYSFNNYDYYDFYDGQQITIGADKKVGETTNVYIQSVNMWGEYSNLECYYYWKLAPDTQQRVYLQNNSYGYSKPYAYFYHPTQGDAIAESWPGIEMQFDDNTNYPYVDVPMGYECSYVIISDNGGAQNPDNGYGYKLNGQTVIVDKNMAWDYYPPTTEGISGDIYLKTDTWGLDGAKLMAYVWTGGNNGMALFDLIGENLYKASLPSGTWKHINFLRIAGDAEPGTEWDNVWNQSQHMIPTGNNYYEMNEGAWDGSGFWGIYDADSGYATSLVGDFNSWDATANVMESNETDDTISTAVTVDEGTYDFKLVQSRISTAYSMRSVDATTGDNTDGTTVETGLWYGSGSTITDTATDVGFSATGGTSTLDASGGTYTFTYDKTTLSLDVTYEPAPEEPAPEVGAPTDYTLVGDFNEWDKSATMLTHTEDPNVIATTVTLGMGAYQFKLVKEGLWWYGNAVTINDEYTDLALSDVGGNITLQTSGGDYTFAYNLETEMLSVSYIPTPDPEPGTVSDVYLTGSFNDWNYTDDAMTYTTGSIVTKTLELPKGDYEFKLFRSDLWYGNEGVIEDTTTATSEVGWEMTDTAPNCTLKASGGTYTFMYNVKTRMLTVTFVGIPDPEAGTVSDVYLTGSFNEWNKTDDAMVYAEGGIVTKTLELPRGEYQFKLFQNELWYGNEGVIEDTTTATSEVGWEMTDTAPDCTLKASGGTYTFMYNVKTRMLEVTFVAAPGPQPGDVSTASIAGDFNDWDCEKDMMVYQSENVVEKTLTLAKGNYTFKIVNGGLWYGNDGVINNTTLTTSAVGWEMSIEKGNCTLQATGGDYKFSYNLDTRMLTITFTPPKATIGAESAVSLAGSFNEWDPTAQMMKYTSDTTVETTVKLVPGSHEFKVVDAYWYGLNDTTINDATTDLQLSNEGSNITLQATGGEYTFTYDITTHVLTIKHVEKDLYEIGSKSDIALAGSFNEWVPTAEMMTYASNEAVTTTLELPKGTYYFKVIRDGFWLGNNGTIEDTTTTTAVYGYEMSVEEGDCTLKASGGTYTFTYNMVYDKLTITYVPGEVTGDVEIGSNSDVTLAGSFNGWNPDAEVMKYSAYDTVTTTIELARGTYQFKLVEGGLWYGNNGTIEDTTTTTAVYGYEMKIEEGDCTLKASGGKYTFSYNLEYKTLTITYVAGSTSLDPSVGDNSTYFLAGDFNGWDPKAQVMTYKSSNVVTTKVSLEAGEYGFKLVNGDFWYGNDGTIVDTTTATSDSGWDMYSTAGNCVLKASGGDYTFDLDLTTMKLTITFEEKVVNPNAVVTIAGDFNDWDPDADKMTTESGNVVTKTMTLSKGTYEFKIVDNNHWYGNNGTIKDTTTSTSSVGWEMTLSAGNCTLNVTGGTYTFRYNKATHMLVIYKD